MRWRNRKKNLPTTTTNESNTTKRGTRDPKPIGDIPLTVCFTCTLKHLTGKKCKSNQCLEIYTTRRNQVGKNFEDCNAFNADDSKVNPNTLLDKITKGRLLLNIQEQSVMMDENLVTKEHKKALYHVQKKLNELISRNDTHERVRFVEEATRLIDSQRKYGCDYKEIKSCLSTGKMLLSHRHSNCQDVQLCVSQLNDVIREIIDKVDNNDEPEIPILRKASEDTREKLENLTSELDESLMRTRELKKQLVAEEEYQQKMREQIAQYKSLLTFTRENIEENLERILC